MLLYLPTRNSILNYLPGSCSRRVMCHFHAIHSPTNSETPIWRSDWDHPQHSQKYVNTSLSPAQPCQEHQQGGWINKTIEISAWLWSIKTHPITTKQLWVMICFVRTALLLQTENKTSWNGCAVMYLSMWQHYVYTYSCNLIYKNTLYSCRDIKNPNPATEIFCFLNQQQVMLLSSLQYRYPDFLTTHPPAQLFCSHTMGFFWFSDKMQELLTQDFLHTQSMPWHQALS